MDHQTLSRCLFGTTIAAQASTQDRADIPQTQAAAGDGTASMALGFPPETFVARAAGGVPPRGADMNGFLNRLSQAVQLLQAGYLGPFDADFATGIGGYPAGAIVAGAVAGTFWVSTTDGNLTAPGATGASWVSLFDGYAALAGAAFAGGVYAPNPEDVPGTNTGTRLATTYWVDEWFAPRAALAQYVSGTGAGGNYPISNLQLKNAPSGDTVVAYLQAQTTWGNILFPSQYNVATQISNYAQPKGDYAQTQWVKDTYAATLYVQQNYALKAQLPLPDNMHVQVFSVTIPKGTACGVKGTPYTVSLPAAFSSFVGAHGSDAGENIYTVTCGPNGNAALNLWCQSPQFPNGPIEADVAVFVTAYGYY